MSRLAGCLARWLKITEPGKTYDLPARQFNAKLEVSTCCFNKTPEGRNEKIGLALLFMNGRLFDAEGIRKSGSPPYPRAHG
jgi:hypothetical protein